MSFTLEEMEQHYLVLVALLFMASKSGLIREAVIIFIKITKLQTV